MQVYEVGGVVRDSLLGLQSQDIDYVVVGATPTKMLAQGFTPVGADFPVFLHPATKAEYALARTERKQGKGHCGFVFYADEDVTLVQDLARRDFTINAIARSEDGYLFDPHGGRSDLAKRVLRHVSPAFREDPLRILRAARYASTMGLSLADTTRDLICEMVAAGELAELSVERIWQELVRGLMHARAVSFVRLLREFGALQVVLPEVDALFAVQQSVHPHSEGDAGMHSLLVLGVAACNWWPLEVRLAALLHDIAKATTPVDKLPHHPGHEERVAALVQAVCQRLRVPKRIASAVVCATREHGVLHKFVQLDAEQRVRWLSRMSVWRNRAKLDCLLAVGECDYAAHPDVNNYAVHPMRKVVNDTLAALATVDVASAIQATDDDPARAVLAARVARLREHMQSNKKRDS